MNGVVRTHFDASMLYLIRIYRSSICFSHLLLKLARKRFRQNEIPFVPLSQVYQQRCNMHQINMIITCESGLENVIETMRSEGCHLKSKQLLPKKTLECSLPAISRDQTQWKLLRKAYITSKRFSIWMTFIDFYGTQFTDVVHICFFFDNESKVKTMEKPARPVCWLIKLIKSMDVVITRSLGIINRP